MLLPDDLIIKKNCTKEMIQASSTKKGSVIATKKVPKKLSHDGVYYLLKIKKKLFSNYRCC